MRFAGFGGLEPRSYEAGYVRDVKRYGGYAAFDASTLRRHVLGYVMVKDAQLTERSVLTSTNYIPVGSRVFVYQALDTTSADRAAKARAASATSSSTAGARPPSASTSRVRITGAAPLTRARSPPT